MKQTWEPVGEPRLTRVTRVLIGNRVCHVAIAPATLESSHPGHASMAGVAFMLFDPAAGATKGDPLMLLGLEDAGSLLDGLTTAIERAKSQPGPVDDPFGILG